MNPVTVHPRVVAQPPRYDTSLGAWLLSRYGDVVAALDAAGLTPGEAAGDPAAHQVLRQAARRIVSAAHVAAWQTELETSAQRITAQLPLHQPVDLVRQFAGPWALDLALRVTGADASSATQLAELARRIFLAAAHASPDDVHASAELARALPAEPGEASAAVQSFVALSQTLPCFLAGAWLMLFQSHDELARLRAQPALLPRAVDELLRLAGPARAIFRRATANINIGGAHIRTGQRVVLLLSAANRDPDWFAQPDRFLPERNGAGLLAFGRGAHFCAGARLIRVAATASTRALLDRVDVRWIGPVQWLGGFAIHGPATLPVELRARHVPDPHP